MLALSDTDCSGTETVLDDLYFPGMERYHERPLESFPGTFEWLFDEEMRMHDCGRDHPSNWTYQDWDTWEYRRCQLAERILHGHAARLVTWLEASDEIFWIQGKAGSGKSTFMKFLCEHERTKEHLRTWANGDVIVVPFFFWAAGSQEEKSYLGLLRGLLHQLLRECPDLVELAFPKRWNCAKNARAHTVPWTKKELLDGMNRLLTAPQNSTRFCFLIDGLDEFDGDHRDLIDGISAMNKYPAVKICISSRPWNLFRKTYGTSADLQFALHELTERDLDTYITNRLESSKATVLSEVELKMLAEDVRQTSQGVFLWANLAVTDLRRGIDEDDSFEMLKARLETYPSELEDFFQHIFDKIESCYLKFAARLLLIVLNTLDNNSLQSPALPAVPSLEDFTADGEYIFDTELSRRDYSLRELIDRAVSCVNKWCRDLIQPIDAEAWHSRINGDHIESGSAWNLETYFGKRRYEFETSDLSFSHRSVYQFVRAKAEDGTLARLAGKKFDVRLAPLQMSVGLAKYAPDLDSFVPFVSNAMRELALGSCTTSDSEDDELVANVQRCLAALDSIGHKIERPSRWTPWNPDDLSGLGSKHETFVRRASVGHEHYTLAAFCIADKWQWLRGVPLQAIERQLQSFSDAQKRFILEVSLISYFYRQSVEHMPGEILQSSSYSLMASVVHIIETCIDVNRPTPRRDCRLDYSMWQFYLLWLHDYPWEGVWIRATHRR